MNANPELRIDMAHRDLRMSPSHNMWIDPDTNRDMRMARPELLEYRQVVNIYLYTQGSCFFQFTQGYAIRGIDNVFGGKAREQPKSHLLNRHRVQATTQMFHQPEDTYIGKGFGCIIEFQPGNGFKGLSEPFKLSLDPGGIVNVERSSKFCCYLVQNSCIHFV